MRCLKSFAITAAILSIPLTSYGWTRTYGGEGRQVGRHIVSVGDGHFVIVGCNNDDLWLLKVDSYGDTIWTRTYDGGGGDKGEYIQQTLEGDYIITGGTHLVDDTGKVWLLKTDPHGDIQWTREYGESGMYLFHFGDVVQQTKDSGFVIIGKTDYEVSYALWVFKTDKQGDIKWSKKYAIPMDLGHAGTLTSDEGCFIAGNWDVIKTDSLGDTLWTQQFGSGCKAVAETYDGNYIVAGCNIFGPKLIVEKVDVQGDLMWIREYESVSYGASRWKATIQEIPGNGGFIVTGFPSPYGEQGLAKFDIWFLRLDEDGDTLWTRTYGGEDVQESYWLSQTNDGGYMVVGMKEIWHTDTADMWLLKTNEYGDTVWYEGEPREVPVPRPDTLVDTIIPTAWFKNSGTYPAEDFYCHCQIWPKGGDTIATLSPPYHCKYLISYPLEPGDSVLVKFAEWFSDDSSRYIARFYTSKDSEPIWQTREKTVEFQGVPDVGIIENPIVLVPAWELANTVGQQITLRYSNFPNGLHCDIFDVSGRKVDELKSFDTSGTITWGDTAPTGVYFIRISSGARSAMRKVILLR